MIESQSLRVIDGTISTYELVGDLYVGYESTLTIEPGVVIKGNDPDDVVHVRGRLEAVDATFSMWASYLNSHARVSVYNGGEFIWTGGVAGPGNRIIVTDNSSADISDVYFRPNTELVYYPGSTGTVTNCTLPTIYLAGGMPTVTGCTFRNSAALHLLDPSQDVSVMQNNTYEGSGPFALVESTLNTSVSFGVIDGVIDNYRLSEDLVIASGATLSLEPGIALTSGSNDYDIFVDGRLEATDAKIGLFGSYFSGYTQLEVRSGGELVWTGGVADDGRILISNGGHAAISNVTFESGAKIEYVDGGGGSISCCSGPQAVVDGGSNVSVRGVDFTEGSVTATGNTGAVDARDNWWGTVDPAAIALQITDCEDEPSLPCVDYEPFMLVPPSVGDPDGDCDFDLSDVSEFMRCVSAGFAVPDCVVFDSTGDEIVSVLDWRVHVGMISGPR